jgi:phage terminase large subunit-like protein
MPSKPVAKQTRKPKPLTPFTSEHFKRYCNNIILDTGEYWEVEDFQMECVNPLFDGFREIWSILPEGNAKTTLLAGVALYHVDYTAAPWVPIAASSRDQAEIMARQGYDMISRSPGMDQRFRVYEGYREIRSRRNGGRGIKVYAADTSTADGVIPTLAICDEGHRHPDMGLYRLWRGKLNKRAGQIFMISTAGEPGSEFEELRDKIRDEAPERERTGAHYVSRGPTVIMNEWKLARAEDAKDVAKVKECNPLLMITEDTLFDEISSPTVDMGLWLRLKCNIPSRAANVGITELEWDDAICEDYQDDIPEGEEIMLGCDVAWKHDCFAMVPLWEEGSYNLLGLPKILTPPRDGSTMHPDEVKTAFAAIHDRTPITTVVIDIERAEDIAAWMEDEYGVIVIDRPQGNAYAAGDYESFTKALRNGTLKHTNHSGLRAHVMHAVTRELPNDKRRFDRPSQSRSRRKQERRVIDALTAAAMVNNYAMNPEEVEDAFPGETEDYRVIRL